MQEVNKFKKGDLVRHKTSSKSSTAWQVISYTSPETVKGIIEAISQSKVGANPTLKHVFCKAFLYGKDKYKYFIEDDLVLVSTKV